jgi:predicted RNA-binding Zn-ribbon protein involved in translation (DUF1610 family)
MQSARTLRRQHESKEKEIGMKLRDVMICLNCDECFQPETVTFLDQRIVVDYCPSCGSYSITRLCRWIPTLNNKVGSPAGAEAVWKGY